MFEDAWNARTNQAQNAVKTLKAEVNRADKQVEQMLNRIVETTNSSVIKAYEQRVEKLEREKALALEQMESVGKPQSSFTETFEHALMFLSSPWNIVTRKNTWH